MFPSLLFQHFAIYVPLITYSVQSLLSPVIYDLWPVVTTCSMSTHGANPPYTSILMKVYFVFVSFNVCSLRMRNVWRDSFLYSCASIYKHKCFIYFVGRSSMRKCIYARGVGSAAIVRELAGACDWPGTVLIPSLSHHTIWFAAAKATRLAVSDGAVLQNKLHSQLFYSCALHNTKVKVGANVIHLNRVQRKKYKMCG